MNIIQRIWNKQNTQLLFPAHWHGPVISLCWHHTIVLINLHLAHIPTCIPQVASLFTLLQTDLFLTRIQLVLIVYQLLILLLALTLRTSHSYFVNQSSNLPLCGSLWKAIFFTLSRLTGSQNNNPVTRMLNFTFLHTSHWALLHSNTMNMFLTTRFLFGPNEHSFWNHSLNKKKKIQRPGISLCSIQNISRRVIQ